MASTIRKESSHKTTSHHGIRNEFLNILIKKHKDELERTVQELAERNNPTLLSIKKVESLFKKHIEFDSRGQLLRELGGSMKATILNTIIAYLVSENKLIVNEDHSLIWIDTKGNEKLNKEFSKAKPI